MNTSAAWRALLGPWKAMPIPNDALKRWAIIDSGRSPGIGQHVIALEIRHENQARLMAAALLLLDALEPGMLEAIAKEIEDLGKNPFVYHHVQTLRRLAEKQRAAIAEARTP